MKRILIAIAVVSLVCAFAETSAAKEKKPKIPIKEPVIGTIFMKENLGEKIYYVKEADGRISALPTKSTGNFNMEELVDKKVSVVCKGNVGAKNLKIQTISSIEETTLDAPKADAEEKQPAKKTKKKKEKAE